MSDPESCTRIKQEMLTPSSEWENMYLSVGPENVLLVEFNNKALRKYIGKTRAVCEGAWRGVEVALYNDHSR